MYRLKTWLIGIALVSTSLHVHAQTLCDPNGNVIVYSNYDGGYLNISVDVNIPNLKVGITTYEDCEITLSGPYVGNVTQVIYAGFQGDNMHCNPSPLTVKINGVPTSIVTILQYPPATWSNPFGNPFIICNYSCDSSSYQGGCNTPDQIVHFFLTQFGGTLRYHYTQYGCWQGTYTVSNGGNCCVGANIIQPQYTLSAYFIASSDSVCIKELVTFTNLTTNTYPGTPSYLWDFGDGTTSTNVNASHAWFLPGTYTVTLTATESSGTYSSTYSLPIQVVNCVPTALPSLQMSDIIFPNPAANFLWMCGLLVSEPTHARVLTSRGASVPLSKPIPSGPCLQTEVSFLPAGIYVLELFTDTRIYRFRFCKG
ncbi:MAG: PKD domain-containing protein [Chitinophagales bacterium]|nr:PKD domain-containing protein [Chitinophagales bacterium]MDW8428648.1 PKD domain-containing protein [Chitinophagales bacterium]